MCLSTCQCKRQKISILAMEAGYSTDKSLSEPLHFAEHGENMMYMNVVLNVRNNYCTQHVLPIFCKMKRF